MKPKTAIDAIIWDLDETIVDTRFLKQARDRRDWAYCRKQISSVKPCSGIMSVLATIEKKLPSAIVTNSPRWYANNILETIGYRPDVVIAYSDTRRPKPHPDPILKAALYLKVAVDHCVVIGDSENDFRAAQNASAQFIGVSWGETSFLEFEKMGVDSIVAAPKDILSFF